MENILSDEDVLAVAELLTWYDADVERLDPIQFSRAIEQAVMQKLREQKPAIYQWTLKRDGFTQYTHLPNNQAEFSGWDVKPLYEHPAPSAMTQVTCQIYGHVVGVCDECSTHAENDINETNRILAANYIELTCGDSVLSVPEGWKAERIDEFEIRVTSPDGEAWRLRSADRNDMFNNFIFRWAEAMLAAAPSAPEWQPIATAPKDGTRVLIKGDCIVVANWGRVTSIVGLIEHGWCIVNDAYMPEHMATHWMPLPKPPMAARSE